MGVDMRSILDGTPPHASIFEGDPQILTRSLQHVSECIEVLRGSLPLSESAPYYPLNLRVIRLNQESVRHLFPTDVNLLVCLGCRPPSATSSVFYIANGGRKLLGHGTSILGPSTSSKSFTRCRRFTAFLTNGGSLEKAAAMANHASTRTTQLYDRRSDEASLDDVELIRI